MPYRRVSALPFAAVLIAALLMSVLPATQANALASIQVGRVQYDPSGTDTTAKLNLEYVELKNISVNPVNLTGWTVRDAHGHVYTFTSYWLGAKKSVTLHTGKGWNTLGHRYWGSGWFIWNNAKPGDTVVVRTRSGGAVDSCKYPGGTPGYKLCW